MIRKPPRLSDPATGVVLDPETGAVIGKTVMRGAVDGVFLMDDGNLHGTMVWTEVGDDEEPDDTCS